MRLATCQFVNSMIPCGKWVIWEIEDMRIIVIVGLPGSGKTHLGESLNVPFHDDATCLPDTHEDFAITHPVFCLEKCRNNLMSKIAEKYGDVDVEWVYFENDPQQCLTNAATRVDKKVDDMIRRLSKEYTPQGDTIPVYGS